MALGRRYLHCASGLGVAGECGTGFAESCFGVKNWCFPFRRWNRLRVEIDSTPFCWESVGELSASLSGPRIATERFLQDLLEAYVTWSNNKTYIF